MIKGFPKTSRTAGNMRSLGNKTTFFMMLPAVILLVITSIYPFIWLFRYVVYDYNGFVAYYTGFDNFKRVFRDLTFWKSVLHTFEYAFLKMIFIIPISLLTAVFLNQKLAAKNLFRTIFFIPTVISAAVASLIFYFIFAAYNGILNGLLQQAHIIHEPVNWLGDPKYAMASVIILAVWGGFGNYMILFLSGLAGIPEDIYESSKIDGAGGIKAFWYVTLPMLGPMMKVILMLAITTALKDYESIMVLTNGGPNNRTQVMFSYIYQMFFGNAASDMSAQMGYGAVLSLIAALIIGIITTIYLNVSKKMDDLY